MTTTIHVLSYALPDAWDNAIDGWLVYLTASGASPATRRTRRAHVRQVARDLAAAHPRDVSTEDLLVILGRPRYSIEYRRSIRSSLVSFYGWAVISGVVEFNPAAALPTIRTPAAAPRPATDEIWSQLLETADERTILMARLACEAGLRRAEVAQVHTDDLSDTSDGPELIVRGKGSKQRVVPITTRLADAIRAACVTGGHLFPGKIDGHIGAHRVGKLVGEVMPARLVDA